MRAVTTAQMPTVSMPTVGVTGPTGNVGGAALARLVESLGAPNVVALARRPEGVAGGVSTRACDYDDAASLRAAFDGLDALVVVSSDGDADVMLRHHLNVVAAARDAGVRRAAYLSSVGAALSSPFCYDRVNALTEDTGVPFHRLQAEQIQRFRDAWAEAGHDREPRVSVSRSIFPITDERDAAYFGLETRSTDQVGVLEGTRSRFGKTYAGEVDQLVAELAKDEAVAAADTLLLTVPNQLGVDYNAHVIENVVKLVAPELGWR